MRHGALCVTLLCMLRILITSDLHYNIVRSQLPARRLARQAVRAGGDALVLVGDTAGVDLDVFAQALDLFEPFKGLKLMVPGNHCLWRSDGGSSMERYEQILPQLAQQHGFAMLDRQPVVLGDAGLVGSIGWYDYSFAQPSLGIPLEFYRQKVSPGAAAYMGMDELVARHRHELTDELLSMGVRWTDGQYVNLGMSDEEFVALLAQRLSSQLDELSPRVSRIVAFLHHLPFRELVPEIGHRRVAFAAAYMGSPLLGEVLRRFPKISHVFCGHSHWHMQARIGHMEVVSIGSTYKEKHLEILEI